MPLTEGQRLGPYEVLGRIGAGGMGEVYRARDTRLDRTVALKVLPSEVSADGAMRSRFEREARAISALAHPHICTLFDVGEQDGQTFLVMEHLEGQTLLARLTKGSLPLAQATQVAQALSAAHKQGIIHRDLKPGNVMLTKTGARLLDFGLAGLTDHGERPGVGLAFTPTEAAPLTGQGTLLGTLPYMAPEQLEGRPADARTDLWALGLLIYEMLTGRRAFEGRSQVSLMGAILEREPEPLARLQPLTPPSLERLVKRCLAKSPDDRWDTAHDVAGELRWIADTGSAGAESTSRQPRWMWTLAIAAAALAGILLGVLAERRLRPSAAPASPVVRTLLEVQPAEELNGGGFYPLGIPTPGGSPTALDWTPDGHALVFVGRRGGIQRLHVRELGRDDAHPLAGTEAAQAPAVSTDGRFVAFWASGEIKRAPILGGPTSVLVPGLDSPPRGMVWSPSGRLYYGGTGGRIWRVAPETAPEAVTTLLETERRHALPHVLPGEKALLFTVRRREWTWGDEEVVAQEVDTSRGTLVRLAASGEAGSPRWAPDNQRIAFSRMVNGVPELVWQRADATAAAERLVRGGHLPSSWSPDGQHLATVLDDAIWIVKVAGSTPTLDRLSDTTDRERWPEFSPDGRWLAYGSNATGRYEIYVQPWPGPGPREQVSLERGWSPAWNPNGRELFFTSPPDAAGRWRMWAVHVQGAS